MDDKPQVSKKLLDADGNPAEIPVSIPFHNVEFFAYETLGTSRAAESMRNRQLSPEAAAEITKALREGTARCKVPTARLPTVKRDPSGMIPPNPEEA